MQICKPYSNLKSKTQNNTFSNIDMDNVASIHIAILETIYVLPTRISELLHFISYTCMYTISELWHCCLLYRTCHVIAEYHYALVNHAQNCL